MTAIANQRLAHAGEVDTRPTGRTLTWPSAAARQRVGGPYFATRWPIRISPRQSRRSRRVSSETWRGFRRCWSSPIDQLGPVGPGWFIIVRQITGALSAPVYAALAGRFRRERVLACSIVARGIAVALVIPVLELHAVNALLFLAIALEGFAQSAPKALNDALLPWLADSPAQLVAANAITALLETAGISVGAVVAAVAIGFSWHVRGIDDRRGALRRWEPGRFSPFVG